MRVAASPIPSLTYPAFGRRIALAPARTTPITDRATYLAWRDKLQLVPVVEGDARLYNVYHVLELNPKNAPRINVRGGRAFADFLVSPEAQRLIGDFGKARFGQSLFVPDAGKEPSR